MTIAKIYRCCNCIDVPDYNRAQFKKKLVPPLKRMDKLYLQHLDQVNAYDNTQLLKTNKTYKYHPQISRCER